MKKPEVVELRECDQCKESLKIVRVKGDLVAREVASGDRHVCWELPQDANLLVLND
jgi:hypothetical protein